MRIELRPIAGGIVTSTLFTLVVVPVLFTYFDAWGRKAKAWLLRHDDEEHEGGGASIEPVLADKHKD